MMRTSGPGQSALLLLDVIDVLAARKIPYAIIGAFAASFYGVVRASVDADAVISLRPSQTDAEALLAVIREAGFQGTYRQGDARDPIGAVLKVEDSFGNRADLLMHIRGMTDAAFTRAVETEFMNTRVRMIGLEDFIAMKLFAGSPKDVDDAAGAFTVSHQRLNLTLLKELVQPYGKDASQRLQALLEAHRTQ